MEKKQRILYCYSQEDFDNLMGSLQWEKPIDKFSTISICAKWNEGFDHWFGNNVEGNFNLDCDDVVRPFWWDKDHYDEAEDLYNKGRIKESNNFFEYYSETCLGGTTLHLFNFEQAFNIVKWIDERIQNGYDNFYVHCAAGLSRSQAVVRYILDAYNVEYHWKTRQSNPCLYPNNHMLLMMKRAARNLQII